MKSQKFTKWIKLPKKYKEAIGKNCFFFVNQKTFSKQKVKIKISE